MASRKKSWQEKLADKPGYPKRVTLETRFPCYNAVHKMGAEAGDQVVLVNPSQVVALMRQVPRGRLTTILDICQNLARRHQARSCCSLTAGIFIMTAANAAEEASSEGRDLDIPYWRTLKADGYLNDKYPGGVQAHKALLEEEGFTVARKGRRYYVAGHEAFLFHDFEDA